MKTTKTTIRTLIAGFGLAAALVAPGTAAAQDCMIGEVKMFAGNFAPRSWALAQGQILSISQNQALFSILGTTYGGDGRTSFGLPDLRGRVPIGTGNGPGLTNRRLGAKGGAETHTLTEAEMPRHNHGVNVRGNQTPQSDRFRSPEGNIAVHAPSRIYTDLAPNAQMAADTIGDAGQDQPHNNMQPFLGMNYIICLQGIYPSRS